MTNTLIFTGQYASDIIGYSVSHINGSGDTIAIIDQRGLTIAHSFFLSANELLEIANFMIARQAEGHRVGEMAR